MADKKILPLGIQLGQAPKGQEAIYRAVNDLYRRLADRTEAMILEGLFADRPAANGTKRFYFATDTNALYYDDGAWNAI